jgi:ribonucleotide monophosphatase NagD (HAD superfamily)
MFEKARKDLKLGTIDTFFIGDGEFDVEAGHRFGQKTVLVLSGKSSRADIVNWKYKPDHIADDLYAAVKLVLKKRKK